MLKLIVATVAVSALVLSTAGAQEPERLEAPLLRVPWTDPTGQGLAVGYDLGLWGQAAGNSLRLRAPFLRQHACLVGRFLAALGPPGSDGADRAIEYGGSFELHGQTDVYLNLMRLYGGGGLEVIHGHTGLDAGRTVWAGKYEFGFEFFISPHVSFTLEVGGNGSATTLTDGPTVFAGINGYTPLLR